MDKDGIVEHRINGDIGYQKRQRLEKIGRAAEALARKHHTTMIVTPFLGKFISLFISSLITVLSITPGHTLPDSLNYIDFWIRVCGFAIGAPYTAFKLWKEFVKPWLDKNKAK